tara:strand:- start:484 stop:1083 length:600 start_codon:yes stop_codon:yes gene_type:complete
MDYTIYKITCNDENIKDCYVGQTCNFTHRKRQHNQTCNNPNDKHHHYKVYECIRNNGGWDNWTMDVIKIYNCVDKFEAIVYERKHYEELNSTLNTMYPGRTQKESNKLYYENNTEKCKENGKLYRENNIEKEQERHKIYSKNNTEKCKERRKIYRENNQAKLREQKQCECGIMYQHTSYSRHLKTQRHHTLIEEKKTMI